MRFRLRLALIFILLSALPLSLLAVWSYLRSSGALRRAIEAEAQLMARDLEHRVGEVATDVDRRVRELARLPTSFWLMTGDAPAGEADAKVLTGFAEALPFIEDFRFVPRAPGAVAGAGSPASTAVGGGSFQFKFGAPDPMAPPHAPPPLSEDQIDAAMRGAVESMKLARANLPANMPPAEREKLVAELE